VLLHTTKHERLEDHVQSSQLLRLELTATSASSILNVLGEPFGELFVRVEQRRHDEVEQRPEFCGVSATVTMWQSPLGYTLTVHRILDRSTGEKQSVPAFQREKTLPPSRR
jgi:hypothetical protein